jgi:acyl carrier protein
MSSTRQTLHERLQHVFRTVFDDESLVLTDATTARDIPAWDSVEHINLMFAIEEAFGIEFAGNELAEFPNVGELRRYLEARQAS